MNRTLIPGYCQLAPRPRVFSVLRPLLCQHTNGVRARELLVPRDRMRGDACQVDFENNNAVGPHDELARAHQGHGPRAAPRARCRRLP